MIVNRDPDAEPELTDAMIQRARETGYQSIYVICDERGAKVGDIGAISFVALVPFLPRKGDRIFLENGRTCEVQNACYKVFKTRDKFGTADSIVLTPTVVAFLVEDGD
jgi:hypothetical protein